MSISTSIHRVQNVSITAQRGVTNRNTAWLNIEVGEYVLTVFGKDGVMPTIEFSDEDREWQVERVEVA